jgi:pimeloyl-ACP methyl ester carboxylesterase
MLVRPSDTASHSAPPPDSTLRAPGFLKLALEGRAPWEFAALLAAAPWLRQLPQGDGHPVIVFPGLGVSDFSTVPMRNFLRDRGYLPHPWRQGFNFGPREGVLEACVAQLKALHAQHRQPVSLIGWSLGGIYARELAKEHPELVRCVITLGSPFTGHPRATNAWRIFELVSGQSAHDPERMAGIRRPPPVPTTSVYSRSDGVVAWQCSLNPDLPHTENIELPASHIGMGVNPLAMYLIADRLRQPLGGWRPFEAQGTRRWFFKAMPRSGEAAAEQTTRPAGAA